MEPALVAMEQGKGNLNVTLVMGRAHSKVIVASAKGLVFIQLLPSYALNAMALVFWAYKYAKNAEEPANSNQR